MTATTGPVHVGRPLTGDALAAARPPGDRYFRHPGDVVRLVIWGVAALLLVLLLRLGKETSEGVTEDLGRAASQIPDAVREFALALAQVSALLVPVVVVALLVWQRRWRRIGLVIVGAAAGVIVFVLVDLYLDLPGRLDDAVSTSTWVTSTRFPSLAYVAGAAGATMVGKPWLARSWRRASDVAIVALVVVVAIAGTAGVIPLLLAVSVGFVGGAAILVALGAPNRRPTPAAIAEVLRDAGIDVSHLTLRRAEGGRAQLYDVDEPSGRQLFVKVYDRDSRDADLLYRGYRTALYRGPNEEWASGSLDRDVEHEALMLLVARRAGVRCPALEVMTALPDGSLALALEQITGPVMADLDAAAIDDALLDETWRQADTLHRNRIAHRALHPSNILVHDGNPVVVDFAAAESSAAPRLLAIDRAELLSSLAPEVGAARAIDSAMRVLAPQDVAAAMPYLQPLALSASTRKRAPKSLLQELRSGIAEATGTDPAPVEKLVRVKARTLVTIAALTGAFYVLLPQLAHVGDSFTALRTANFAWLLVALVMSGLTYVASAIGLVGGVPNHLPMIPTIETQLASSFVNRVTPANVGGMALNVRFMQKAGVDPAGRGLGHGPERRGGRHRAHRAVVRLLRVGGQGDGELQDPDEQQDARHHRGGAGRRRHRRGHAPWSEARTHARCRFHQAVGHEHRVAGPVPGQAPAPLRRVPGCDARLHRRACGVGGRVSRRSQLRRGRGRLPRSGAPRCRGSDPGRPRCARGSARRRVHRRRDGVRRCRCGGAELSAPDVLATDPARLDQLPHPRAPQPHLARVLGSEALAAEPEAPARERAEQEPEARSADHVEGQVHTGVHAGERHQ